MKIRHYILWLVVLLLPLGAAAQRQSAALVDAVALYDKGDMAGAERLLTRLTEADPSDDALWYYLGKAEAAQGKTAAAPSPPFIPGAARPRWSSACMKAS